MIERSYPAGNRITLTTVEAVFTEIPPGQPGHVVVSIFEQSGHTDVRAPYFVRGHVVTESRTKSNPPRTLGIERRIGNIGAECSTIDDAREVARAMCAQLYALWLMETVEATDEEAGGPWWLRAAQATTDERAACAKVVDDLSASVQHEIDTTYPTGRSLDALVAARTVLDKAAQQIKARRMDGAE